MVLLQARKVRKLMKTVASKQWLNVQRCGVCPSSALYAEPNPAHYALSLLCIPTCLHTLAPSAEFTLVTQNIDGLSSRALDISASKSADDLGGELSKIYEMHGNVLDTLCTICGHRERNASSPLCHALELLDVDAECPNLPVESLPHCVHCGGLLRPGVVWFDEIPRHLREIWEVVDKADLCLVIGTSSQVICVPSAVIEAALTLS